MRITASTPLFALLGHPVKQSLSPILQNGWIQEHGFEGVYVALDIKTDEFVAALTGLFQSGLSGANVTTPFKEDAARAAISLSIRAHATNSVNCLTYTEHGFTGDSTDGAGFIADLDSRAAGWRDVPGPVVVLGAGGAARSILYALANTGVKDIIVVNRNLTRALAAMSVLPDGTGQQRPWADVNSALVGASLVINATSAGFKGDDPLELDMSQTHPNCLAYDSVYAPRHTSFLRSAQDQKRKTLDGLGMLVGQGALAFQAWFGVMPDLRSGLARLEAELSS